MERNAKQKNLSYDEKTENFRGTLIYSPTQMSRLRTYGTRVPEQCWNGALRVGKWIWTEVQSERQPRPREYFKPEREGTAFTPAFSFPVLMHHPGVPFASVISENSKFQALFDMGSLYFPYMLVAFCCKGALRLWKLHSICSEIANSKVDMNHSSACAISMEILLLHVLRQVRKKQDKWTAA